MITFFPPSGPFRLELQGKTKKGNAFVRVSARKDRAVSVILRQSYTLYSSILRRSQTTQLRVQIRRGNTGDGIARYTVSMKDQGGYGRVLTKYVTVRRQRIGFAKIEFRVPTNAPRGKLERVGTYLTKEGTMEIIASLTVTLLLV